MLNQILSLTEHGKGWMGGLLTLDNKNVGLAWGAGGLKSVTLAVGAEVNLYMHHQDSFSAKSIAVLISGACKELSTSSFQARVA